MSPLDLNELGKLIEDGIQEAAPKVAEDVASMIMGWYDQQAEEVENAEAIQTQAVRKGMECVKLAGVDPNLKRNDGGTVVRCTCGGRNFMCGCNGKGGWLIPKGYKIATCGKCMGSGNPKLVSGLWYCPGCNSAGSVAVKSK